MTFLRWFSREWLPSIGIVAVLAGILMLLDWYRAGVQAEVYRREGIEVTQWEVFCGAKPAERTITNQKESR